MADSLDSGSSVLYGRAGSSPASRTSSEIPAVVPFPALPKTALWWEFLRFPPRLASLDSRRKGNGGTRGGRKIDFDGLLQTHTLIKTQSARVRTRLFPAHLYQKVPIPPQVHAVIAMCYNQLSRAEFMEIY